MQDALTEEERIALQSSRRVTKEMERQWNNAPDAVESDRPDEPSIWRNICKEVWQHDEGRKVVFYKIYSMVASILLVLGVAGTVYFALQDKANVPMYVVYLSASTICLVILPVCRSTKIFSSGETKYSFIWFVSLFSTLTLILPFRRIASILFSML